MKLKSVQWWKAKEGDCHREVWATARAIEAEQQGRRTMMRLARTLYGDEQRPYTSWASGAAGIGVPIINPYADAKGSISYNLARVAVDSLTARIAKNKPKATFVTNGGDWSQRRRAQRLDAFVYGTFHESNLYATGRRVFRDGCKYGLGVLKGYLDGEKVCLERVLPDEILVGAMDGKYSRPRSIFQRTWVSREIAEGWIDAWHEKKTKAERAALKGAIVQADPCLAQDSGSRLKVLAELGSVVCVVEAWHLPSGPDADDGRHVVTISNTTLLDEEWAHGRFPFAFFRFHERDEGFDGQGVPEMLLPDQRAVSFICRKIQRALDLMTTPFFFLPNGSDIAVASMTNEVGRIVRGNAPPQVVAPSAVPPELFQQYQTSVREALEKVGINQLSVAGQKPPGIDSAVGLREQQDIESGRFADVISAYDEFFVAAGHLVTDLARQADETGIKLKALNRERRRVYAVNWKEAALDEDEYALQVFASSSLPQTPAARKQYVRELWQDHLITNERYRELLDMPDLAADATAEGAGRDYVESLIERFLDGDDDSGAEDVYEAPEKFMPLEFGIQRMQQAYLTAKMQGAPPARLELLLRWADQAAAMLAPPPEAAPPAPAAMPGAAPVAPPGGPMPLAPPGAPPMPPMAA